MTNEFAFSYTLDIVDVIVTRDAFFMKYIGGQVVTRIITQTTTEPK